ncbi:adenylate isopentenyltransferase-like [Panicum miliaceum]|uniref:Adenylate isopentenyltransferase-like n=1 Tax=Panicum miliaceum TaxID=4540 RepID=A0A3L6PX10_PANMI|nr:adenylate isopentenyltransferase-like [Panicum miliaceum]
MGKMKLSIDVTKVIGGEVINADKMQIYAGLDIATNKVTVFFSYSGLRCRRYPSPRRVPRAVE